MSEPRISWEENIEHDRFQCRVTVPRSWLMERSLWKRRLRLWWWLTRLALTLPR
jgi:hypothetical protein